MQMQPVADPILKILELFRADTRAHRIDLGVGVYRDESGATPVLQSVKVAEHRLWESQDTKTYLGLAGNTAFSDALGRLIFGPQSDDTPLTALQAVGGSGALRLAFEFAGKSAGSRRLFVSTPTWENQSGIAAACGLEVARYPYFDPETGRVAIDAMLACLDTLGPSDAVLLHGCCHNPTGADPGLADWQSIATLAERRGWLPVVDLAYAGFGESIEADTAGLRTLVERLPRVIAAVSCSKNFGLYRERTGAVYVTSASAAQARAAQADLMHIARQIWSMSPDHGAAIVAMILEDEALYGQWQGELSAMRNRLKQMRLLLSAGLRPKLDDARFTALDRQQGMFSLLPLTTNQVNVLREEHAIYLIDDGRINVAGITTANAPVIVKAIAAVQAV